MSHEQDDRLDFDQAVALVRQQPAQVAFAAMPVFGELSDDAEQRAEGVRIFIVEADGRGGHQLRFVAGPFFANVHGANDIFSAADIPERVRELRFMVSRLDPDWLEGQIQILVQKLVQASGQGAPQMPDYEHAAQPADNVFPLTFAERGPQSR